MSNSDDSPTGEGPAEQPQSLSDSEPGMTIVQSSIAPPPERFTPPPEKK